MKISSRVALKVKFRDRGILVRPSFCYPDGKTALSISLPPPTFKKLKKLSLVFKYEGVTLFHLLLKQFEFEKCDITDEMFARDFEKYIDKKKLDLKQKYKHEDYKFATRMILTKQFDEINSIAKYYGLSRSSFVRILIDSFDYSEYILNKEKL